MKKRIGFLSFVLSAFMIISSVQGLWVFAEEATVIVSSSDAEFAITNVKTNTCDSSMDAAEVVIDAVSDGGEIVHRYSAKKTTNNIQQLYRVEGLSGTTHVASYDIKFGEIYLDENARNTETIVSFRGFDDSGAGSGKDYNPYIEAVKATKNDEAVASLTTVNGDSIDYDKWYTFYMAVKIDGNKRYSSLYYKERDSAEAVKFVNETSDEYSRDGVLSYVYVYAVSKVFNSEKTSVFYIDNVSFRNQEMIFAAGSEIADVYGTETQICTDVYLTPGFSSAKAYVDDEYAQIYSSADGKYHICVPAQNLATGDHSFKIVASYGRDNFENVLTYEKEFRTEENVMEVQNGGELFKSGVSYTGQTTPFLAVPAGASQTYDDTVVKVALDDTTASGTEYIKIPFYSTGTSYYNAASLNTSHAISFDMKLDGIVGASTSQKDLMQIRGLKNGSWTGGTYKLTVVKNGDSTVIRGLGTDYEIKQNVWYTFTFVTNPSNATYNVYCSQKGSGEVCLMGTVSDADTASINCIALGLLKGNCTIQTKTDSAERIAPDIYLDNLCIREALKTDGRSISDKLYTTGDEFVTDVYIAPGFEFAQAVFGDEKAQINDNSLGIYTIKKSLASVEAPDTIDFTISAKYGDNVVTSKQTVNVYAKTAYTIHKDSNGGDMYYTVDNAETTDGVFPCMSIEQGIAEYSLDTGKGGTGKSLKAKYIGVGNEKAYCNFGYTGGDASAIGNDRYTRISMDVKFSTREFRVKVQHKFNGSWPSAGSSKEFIDKYGIVQASTGFYYDTDKWYNIAYVVDTVKSEGKFYLDGEYIGTNSFSVGEIENPTQLQFCIAHKSASTDKPAYMWADNLKIETSPYCFEGITGNRYEKASADVASLAITPVSNPGSGLLALSEYSDGTSAGDVVVDAVTGAAVLNADGVFDTMRDITFKYIDQSTGKLVAIQTYAFVGNNGMAIYDPEITSEDGNVVATVYAAGGNEASTATLFLVSYSGADKKTVSAVDISKITASQARTSYTASLPAESGTEFSVYVWDGNTALPLKKSVSISE